MNNISQLICLFFLFVFTHLTGYTYIDKINEANRLTKKAKNLLENGEYNKSIEISKEARKVLSFIDKMIPVVKKLNLLENQIQVAKQINAQKYAPKEFGEGNKSYLIAYDLLKKNEDILGSEKIADKGIKSIQEAIEIAKKTIEETNKPKIITVEKVEKEVEGKVEKYYIVKLNLEKRDSLWSIAGKKEVYGDSWKWIIIYDKNRNQIDDPNLIYPEQKLIIPPVPSKKKLLEIKKKLKKVWTHIHK